MRLVQVVLTIEAKDDETQTGTRPAEPDDAQVQVYLTDLLSDQTRRDERIGWRTRQIVVGP